MSQSVHDPYLYPKTSILKNRFNIRDQEALNQVEARFFKLRLEQGVPDGSFDYEHYKNIHRHFFGDLYEWAGEERTINMSKGHSQFALTDFIEPSVKKLLEQLKKDNYLRNVDKKTFTKKIGFLFNELNAIHPFREGNGRMQRLFVAEIAKKAGYVVDWKKVKREEYMMASLKGFYEVDSTPIAKLIEKITARKVTTTYKKAKSYKENVL